MEDIKEVFRDRFTKARERKGYKLKDIAQLLDPNNEDINAESKVKQWSAGHNLPKAETLIKLADILGCDLDYLVGNIEEKSHNDKFICEETGLSESALEYIKELPEMEKDILNEFLCPESGLSTILKIIFAARYESCSSDDLIKEQGGSADKELIEAVKKIAAAKDEKNLLAAYFSLKEPNEIIKNAKLKQLELKGKLQATFYEIMDKFIPPVCPPEIQNNDDSLSFVYEDSIEETYHNAIYGLLDNELHEKAQILAEIDKKDHEKAITIVIAILKKHLGLNNKAARHQAIEILCPPIGERAAFCGEDVVVKNDGTVTYLQENPE